MIKDNEIVELFLVVSLFFPKSKKIDEGKLLN